MSDLTPQRRSIIVDLYLAAAKAQARWFAEEMQRLRAERERKQRERP